MTLPEKLRAIAQRGAKHTARDVAVLHQAAHHVEVLADAQRAQFGVHRDQLDEIVRTRTRLNALIDVIDGALNETRDQIPINEKQT